LNKAVSPDAIRTSGTGVGGGVEVGVKTGVGLGPAVKVGIAVGAGAGNGWQAVIKIMNHSPMILLESFIQTLF